MDVNDAVELLAENALEWRTGVVNGWRVATPMDRQSAVEHARTQLHLLAIIKHPAAIEDDGAVVVTDSVGREYPSILREAVMATCNLCSVDYSTLRGHRKSRSRSYVVARRTCSWIARKIVKPKPSYPEIAAAVYGKCCHASVVYQVQEYTNDAECHTVAAKVCDHLGLTKEYVAAMRAEGLVPMAVA